MSNKSLQSIEFKRLLRQYEFAMQDLEDLKEIQSTINADFNSAIAGLKRADLFDNKKVEAMADAEDAKDDKQEEPERDPSFKKLFRKIVVKCHPDRLASDLSKREVAAMKEYYENAVKANDDYNWALLITVAIRMEIELGEEYYDHIESLRNETVKLDKEIQSIQTSVAWTWYHAKDDDKDIILSKYVEFMEKAINSTKSIKVKVLGVGHPRTGTGFTSKLLKSWGLDVGHEVLGTDGIVAWQLAVKNGPWPYITSFENSLQPEIMIYNVRDPKDSIPSIVFTENTKPESLEFRINKGKVIKSSNSVEMAINSILAWDRLILSMDPDFIYRIEDQDRDLFEYLQSKGLKITYSTINDKVNAREHPGLESLENEKRTVRPSVKRKLNDFCVRYGYDLFFT